MFGLNGKSAELAEIAVIFIALIFFTSAAAFTLKNIQVIKEMEYQEPVVYADVATPSTRGLASRFVFVDASGAGHVEQGENSRLDEERGVVEICCKDFDAAFSVVADAPDTVAKVTTNKGAALRRGDEVVVPAGEGTALYHVRFVHVEPEPAPPTEEDAPVASEGDDPDWGDEGSDDGYDVYYDEDYDEYYSGSVDGYGYQGGVRYDWVGVDSDDIAPDGTLTRWNAECGYKWYLAHSYTDYGRAIASLRVGDQVTVDGNTVTIEGVTRAPAGTRPSIIYQEIGGHGKTVFQTCVDDGTDDVYIFYGE